MSSLCVYCGSSGKVDPKYKISAQKVGEEIARRKLRLIYGGGHVGLMGIVADSVLAGGSPVVGIIPEHLRSQEPEHTGLTELHIVPDMHTRKRMMVDRSDAFLVLPGGFGTLDETFEIITWRKLKLHNDPIIVLNQDGYWDDMLKLIDRAISEGFAAPTDSSLYEVATSVDDAFALLDRQMAVQQTPLTGRM
ncbi:MAG: TIGR00730 family Rossman fold protein [Alphaproteobacteria bacterium]|nr:TIGR00730 family Rossman fold protein [Alphaproteobacteria bacterium]